MSSPLQAPVWLRAWTASSALGLGNTALQQALQSQASGLKPCDFMGCNLPTFIGETPGVNAVELPPHLRAFDCRNNRLAYLGLLQDGFLEQLRASIARHSRHRIGVFIGTSTSGLQQTEAAYAGRTSADAPLPAWFNYLGTQNAYSTAAFVRELLAIEGPAQAICTACSSSAKAFVTAQRYLAAGLIDAAIVGGVDSLCKTTLYGFNALQLTAPGACRPFDAHRDGLSVSEAAAFVLLEPPGSELRSDDILLRGWAESSDAWHMTAPHPEGDGATSAMRQALELAGVSPAQVDYINLHGTGTPSNDAAEGKAVARLFGAQVPASSTKGATGHALGAAGALEAIICAIAMRHGFIPGGINTRVVDEALDLDYRLHNSPSPMRRTLSNSFGFGGANCSLLFERQS